MSDESRTASTGDLVGQGTAGDGEDTRPRIIKRYANRKLYDTSRSAYVTLEDIADQIRDGIDVRVIDNRTQDDLTSVTLAQIIFEQQKSRRWAMPMSTLRAIIERPAELLQRLSHPVSHLRGEAARQVERLQRRGEHDEGAEEAAESLPSQEMIVAVERLQSALDETREQVEARIGPALDALNLVPDLQAEIAELRERLERLEQGSADRSPPDP